MYSRSRALLLLPAARCYCEPMCGIGGVVGDGAPEDEGAVRRMTAALAHRGPDAEGIWRSGPCVLGHRRLSIARPLAGGEASRSSPGVMARSAAVVNGEIYNFPGAPA